MAAVHAGDRQACGSDQRMGAMTHDFLVMLRDEAQKLAGTIDRVLAEMRRAGMRRHAVHPHDRAQTSLVRGEGGVGGRLADHGGIDLRTAGGIELGAFAGDFLVGDEDAEQRARPCRAIGGEHAHGLQHRRERPLAVAGAATVEPSIRLPSGQTDRTTSHRPPAPRPYGC